MCNQTTEEAKYKKYDKVVATVLINVIIEKERCGKFLIYDFDQTDDGNKLYFNVTTIEADLQKEKIYLDMPLLDFLSFWKKRRKNRRNLRWLNPIQKKRLPAENKTSTSIMMDFICERLKLNYHLFKEINDEYYGWID